MKRIGIYGKSIPKENYKFINSLVDCIRKEINPQIFLYKELVNIPSLYFEKDDLVFGGEELINSKVDLLISFGGDGTLLDTVTMIKNSNIPILGINAGRLGFLANITQEDIVSAVKVIKDKKFRIDERTLVEVVNFEDLNGIDCNFALNEITVHKKDSSSMLKIHTYVDNEFLNTYWSDGLIVSTPTGSTAYSLSCGGPILSPSSDNFIINPISPHNLNLRPLVVSDNVEIKLATESREGQFLLTMDSRSVTVENNVPIILKKANFNIKLIELPDQNFFRTIRNKLFWGKDSRN
jgi:NAD+ kinase